MHSVKTKILYNERIAPRFYKLGLSWKTPEIEPGHFVMLRVSDGLDPLLRRPFGIYNVIGSKGKKSFKGSGIELLYRVVGKGTRILSEKRPEETLELLGPLGNGFPAQDRNKKVVMMAGGMGIVPLYLLAKRIDKGMVIFGARSRAEAGVAREFREITDLRVATEDGSVGRKGIVTDLLEEEVTADTVVYACGPVGMLKRASRIAEAAGARCYVSLERSMACGIGVCLGCAVKSRPRREEENRNYMMVCSEGPVFDSTDIDWDAL